MLLFYLNNSVWKSWNIWKILAAKQYRTKAVPIFQILSKIEKWSLIVPSPHFQHEYYLPFCGCLPAIVNPWMPHLLSTSLWKQECSKRNVAITVCMLVNCPVFLEACTSTGLWNIIFTPLVWTITEKYEEAELITNTVSSNGSAGQGFLFDLIR